MARVLGRGLISTIIIFALAGPAMAGDAAYRAPRTAFGQPDFEGVWSNASLTSLERPDALKTLVVSQADAEAYEKPRVGQPPEDIVADVGGATSEWWETDNGLARIRGQIRTSWLVAPSDGKLPFNAAALAERAERRKRTDRLDNPEARPLSERCLEPGNAGPPMFNGPYNSHFQILQTRDQIAIRSEADAGMRIIPLTARHALPPQVRRWNGDSIGRWEGDTLVVETTNFTAREVNAPDRNPAADMRVIERFTRTAAGEITYEFIVEDFASFDQSWQGEMVFRAAKGPMFEYACHEGNYGMANILAGARQMEANPKPETAAASTAGPASSAPSPTGQ